MKDEREYLYLNKFLLKVIYLLNNNALLNKLLELLQQLCLHVLLLNLIFVRESANTGNETEQKKNKLTHTIV